MPLDVDLIFIWRPWVRGCITGSRAWRALSRRASSTEAPPGSNGRRYSHAVASAKAGWNSAGTGGRTVSACEQNQSPPTGILSALVGVRSRVVLADTATTASCMVREKGGLADTTSRAVPTVLTARLA